MFKKIDVTRVCEYTVNNVEVLRMSATNLNIRTDKEIKNQAEEIFNELGLNMTTAINMFLRTVVREYGIPFELKLDVPQETAAEAALESKKMLSDLSECKFSNEETIKG